MSDYSICFKLRTDQPDIHGKCMIRLRVIMNRETKYVSTGIKVPPDAWEDASEKIVHTYPNAKQLNFKLNEFKLNHERELLNVERITGNLTAAKVEAILAKKDIFDFHDYAAKYFETFKIEFKEETLETYGYDLEKLKEFAPRLSLHEITPEFVARYHNFMVTVRGNSQNTCNKALKPIKKVLRYAREVDKIIKDDPFKVYNISKEETIPTYLTMDELEQIWDLVVNHPKPLYHYHHSVRIQSLYFLLSCYTGLRYSDLTKIQSGEVIKNDRVFLIMQKGQEPLSLPLLSRAKKLIPLIGNAKILSNQKGNERLKILQQIAGLNKDLTWHVGRHTMAMMMADLGFDKEITAVLLGHKSIKSTAIYHRISSSRGNKEVANLEQKLAEVGHI